MGTIHANISLRNPPEGDLHGIDVNALVDTGALHLCIPEHIANQLRLSKLYERTVTTADGREHVCDYVGPLEIKFENRGCFTGALVLGDEVLLGAVPMEDMDVLLSPADRKMVVNPRSPNIASSIVK